MKIFFRVVLFFINKIEFFVTIFAVLAGFIMFVVVLIGIISRYVMSSPYGWVEEVARYSYCIMVFFGMILVLKNRENIKIEFLFNKFSRVTKSIINIIYDVFIIVFISVFIYYGYILAIDSKNLLTESLGFSKMYIYIIIPFAALGMLIQVVKRIVSNILDLRVKE